jgi:hypothetical protein
MSVTGLICLVDHFREEHAEWKSVEVLAFTSAVGAADKLPDPHDSVTLDRTGKPVEARVASGFANQVRAMFVITPARESTSLVLTPAGLLTDDSYLTHIDLSSSSKPRCSLSLSERCVLEMTRLDVPSQTWRESFLGTVTLSGTARRDGTLERIRIESISAGEDFATVARELAKSLESWRVDPGKENDHFQATFTYKLSASLFPGPAALEVTRSGISVIHSKR